MPTKLLYSDAPYQRQCLAQVLRVAEDGIILDQTVFYPTGGGQPGDTGTLRCGEDHGLRIVDTVKTDAGEVLHRLAPQSDSAWPETGAQVHAEIDWDRRYAHMKMHTCLHLLCSLVDAPVTGGSIGAERARLDFDLPDPVDKAVLTDRLNDLIRQDHVVASRWIDEEELDAKPELVRTLSVQPPRGGGRIRLMEIPGVDLQPCGGTHVARSGEIGSVRISKIEKKSRLNRRIVVVFDA